jgi:hypothetical protein
VHWRRNQDLGNCCGIVDYCKDSVRTRGSVKHFSVIVNFLWLTTAALRLSKNQVRRPGQDSEQNESKNSEVDGINSSRLRTGLFFSFHFPSYYCLVRKKQIGPPSGGGESGPFQEGSYDYPKM